LEKLITLKESTEIGDLKMELDSTKKLLKDPLLKKNMDLKMLIL
jgi:hypothetical protein